MRYFKQAIVIAIVGTLAPAFVLAKVGTITTILGQVEIVRVTDTEVALQIVGSLRIETCDGVQCDSLSMVELSLERAVVYLRPRDSGFFAWTIPEGGPSEIDLRARVMNSGGSLRNGMDALTEILRVNERENQLVWIHLENPTFSIFGGAITEVSSEVVRVTDPELK